MGQLVDIMETHAGLVNLDLVAVFFPRLGLGKTDGSDGGVTFVSMRRIHHSREDDTGDVVIRQLVILVLVTTKESVGKTSPGSDRDRGQQSFSADISNGVDTGNVGVLIVIGKDVSLFIMFETEFDGAKFLGIGMSTDSPEKDVYFERFGLRIKGQSQSARFRLFDRFHIGLFVHVEPGLFCVSASKQMTTHPYKGSGCPG